MKNLALRIFFALTVCLISTHTWAQKSISPDKMISHIRDQGESMAFTIPGWIIKLAGNFVENDLDDNEKEMVHELTDHIKKLRFVVTEDIPKDYHEKLEQMKNYFKKKNYEPLIEARDDGSEVNIWGRFDGDIIENLVISVFSEGDETVLFNIKSKIDLNRLQEMEFFKEYAEKQGIGPDSMLHY
ncbi:MAG: DUF4252 domain-containing protein [Saprospiraceae bacterium]|nr:DUF4252 domain-containing protein [Saprospiraceae bacterium]